MRKYALDKDYATTATATAAYQVIMVCSRSAYCTLPFEYKAKTYLQVEEKTKRPMIFITN